MNAWMALALGVSLASAAGGEIRGTVKAEGKTAAEGAGGGGGAYASRKFKFVERVDYSTLQDFVVYVDEPIGVGAKSAPKVKEVTQKDATFQPHVLPVVVGTTVRWPNEDDILHNVYSFSDAKQFDLGLYKGAAKTVEFDHTGRVDVFCSIHSKMHCVVLVLENPYFAKSKADGTFVIPDVPAGKYRLKAWHERLPSQVMEVTVPDKGVVEADFVLGIKGLPKY